MWPFTRKPKAAVIQFPTVTRPRRNGAKVVELGTIAGRTYAGSKVSPTTLSMARSPRPSDGDMHRAINVLKARSREEYESNDYAKNGIKLIKQNVIGPNGIGLQPDPRRRNGDKDKPAAQAIAKAWADFGMRGRPDVARTRSLIDIQNVFMHSLAVDGEALIIRHMNWDRNDYGVAFELVDSVLLDINLNKDLGNGRKIRMGVELDQWGGPVNYYLNQQDPLQDDYQRSRTYRVVPADDVMHVFLPESAFQTRGVPWLATSLIRFNMARGYEDAELVAARVAASKMGFFIEGENASKYQGEAQDEDGNAFLEASEPGQFGRLPFGTELETYDPQHPNSNYAGYLKALLKGAAAGLGVQYNTMAQDFESVNFSSLKAANQDAQDGWRTFQTLIKTSLMQFMYDAWLPSSILRGAIEIRPGAPLSAALLPKYREIRWNPRTWEHVQPLEEARANDIKLANGSTTLSHIYRSQGLDPEVMLTERADEQKFMDSIGVELGPPGSTTEDETSQSDQDDETSDPDGNEEDDGAV